MAQVHQCTSTTHTQLSTSAPRKWRESCRVLPGPAGDQYSVSLWAPQGAKHFHRADRCLRKATMVLPGRIQVVSPKKAFEDGYTRRPLTPVMTMTPERICGRYANDCTSQGDLSRAGPIFLRPASAWMEAGNARSRPRSAAWIDAI